MSGSLVSTYALSTPTPSILFYTGFHLVDLESLTSRSYNHAISLIEEQKIADKTCSPIVSQPSAVVSSLKKVANAAPTAVNAVQTCAKANANASHQNGETLDEDIKIGNNMDHG